MRDPTEKVKKKKQSGYAADEGREWKDVKKKWWTICGFVLLVFVFFKMILLWIIINYYYYYVIIIIIIIITTKQCNEIVRACAVSRCFAIILIVSELVDKGYICIYTHIYVYISTCNHVRRPFRNPLSFIYAPSHLLPTCRPFERRKQDSEYKSFRAYPPDI